MSCYPDSHETVQKRAAWSSGVLLSYARIIVADDDADCRELVSAALHAPGNEILFATNGGELLDLVAEHDDFDLIITDINMPWMEGLQVLASIRSAGLRTPVLVITGLTRPDLPAAIARMGNAGLLHKPIAIADLRGAIAELLVGEAVT